MMRRTITTLMILAMAGLAYTAQAAEKNSGSSDYYAAGTSTYKISDDDEAEDEAPAAVKPASAAASVAAKPATSASRPATSVAKAVGQPEQAGQEKHALYLADKSKLGDELLQTSFFDAGCGCKDSCGSGNCCGDCDCCGCAVNTFRAEWITWWTRGRNTP